MVLGVPRDQEHLLAINVVINDEDRVGPDVTGKAVELNGGVQSSELLLQFVDRLVQPVDLGLWSSCRLSNYICLT